MNIRDFILGLFGYRRAEEHRYQLSADIHMELVNLAEMEQRPVEDVQAELLAGALAQRRTRGELWNIWQTLSIREQDVAALTCQGYTNKEIATRLNVSTETVKGYIRQVLMKYHLHSKYELRMLIGHWNYSDWGPKAPD